jgi:hypothetical protein
MICAAAGAVGIEDATMHTAMPSLIDFAKAPWNKGRLTGQKRPLKPKDADSDEVARAFRDDVARDYEMISPGCGAPLA